MDLKVAAMKKTLALVLSLFFISLSMPNSAYALLPAALPDKEAVAATEPLPIDGVWTISTLNKRIQIEEGRAWAVDSWVHALLWTVSPDMVVIQNIEEIAPGEYEGDDLPLLGKAHFTQQDDGTIKVHVAGALGPYDYVLIPAPLDEEAIDEEAADKDAAGAGDEPFEETEEVNQAQPASGNVYEEVIEEDDETNASGVSDSNQQPAQFVIAVGGQHDQPKPSKRSNGYSSAHPEFVSVNTFTGCDDGTAVPESDSPRNRIEKAAQVDKITQRTFASFSIDELEEELPNEDMEELCWYRIDGVWRETGEITVDRSLDQPEIWGSDTPEMIVLANGNYTTPSYLFIGSTGNDDKEIYLSDAFTKTHFARFVSTGGPSLKETLQRDGPRKTYITKNPFHLGNKLTVDVTKSGRVRLKLGNTTFIRPKPGVSKSTMASQIAANDAFLLSYNLENLSASRKGYDIVSQDPFYLLQNPKSEVFAEVSPQEYFISEKRTVPLGFTLVQEANQGMVYNRNVITSATELQETISGSLGVNLKSNTYPIGIPNKSSASVEVTASHMESREQSSTVAQAIGYSRAKQYALVVDHPYVSLSDDFIDAIEDARRYGNYQAILDNFGTHYPYAVTYGAAAKVTHSVSEDSYRQMVQTEGGISGEFATETLGNGGGAHFSLNVGKSTGSSGSVGEEGATFVAVGGNGSWNENGYAAGATPYPILLDLRPVYELLNPLNFPDEPEIYEVVRPKLRDHIKNYLTKHSNKLSTVSTLPAVERKPPEPIETWHIYVRSIWCTGTVIEAGRVKYATGKLRMDAYQGNKNSGVKTTNKNDLQVLCKRKKKKKAETYDYRKSTPGLIEIKGTRSQISKYVIDLDLKWRYKPALTKKWRNHTKSYKQPDALKKGLAPGKSATYNWSVGAKTLPDFTLAVRMKRIK